MTRLRRSATTDPADRAGYTVEGHQFDARPLAPGLYVVATPIGNLGDVSLRALATLAAADLVACEDTRVTRILTDRYGITTPLIAYHDHNAARQRPKLLAALAEGKVVALVSDAGTPLVSDPGYRLVNAALAAGHSVVPVPGASAVLAALVASGLPSDAFLFGGFLPSKPSARRRRLGDFAATPATLIFFESPHRLAASLADMVVVLGAARACAVVRELTKTFETVRRDTLGELAAGFAAAPPPKGEVVVAVGPPEPGEPDAADVDTLLLELLADHPVRAASAEAAARTGLSRRELYQRALFLTGKRNHGAA
jgi:16S rRNA (cytidine1402-2'-O)-methyltransferase